MVKLQDEDDKSLPPLEPDNIQEVTSDNESEADSDTEVDIKKSRKNVEEVVNNFSMDDPELVDKCGVSQDEFAKIVEVMQDGNSKLIIEQMNSIMTKVFGEQNTALGCQLSNIIVNNMENLGDIIDNANTDSDMTDSDDSGSDDNNDE